MLVKYEKFASINEQEKGECWAVALAETQVNAIAEQWRVCIDPLVGDKAFAENVSQARFANPAAYHVHNTAKAVLEFVLQGSGEEAAYAELDDLARLFALRTNAPSASLKCFFDLRDLVHKELGATLGSSEVSPIQQRIDSCMLHTTDAFIASREKLGSIAMDELKRRNEMLEKLANDYTTGGEQV